MFHRCYGGWVGKDDAGDDNAVVLEGVMAGGGDERW